MIHKGVKAYAPMHEKDCTHTGEYTMFAQARLIRSYAKTYRATGDNTYKERGIAIKVATVTLFQAIKEQLTYVDDKGKLLVND